MSKTSPVTQSILDLGTLKSRPVLLGDDAKWEVGDFLVYFNALSVGHPVDELGCPNEEEHEVKVATILTSQRAFEMIANNFFYIKPVKGDDESIAPMIKFVHKELPFEERQAIDIYFETIQEEVEEVNKKLDRQ